jgi:hypothetical protein
MDLILLEVVEHPVIGTGVDGWHGSRDKGSRRLFSRCVPGTIRGVGLCPFERSLKWSI